MKINSIFSNFTPKDTKFIPLLKEAAAIMNEAAILLELLFTSGKRSKDLCQQIKAEEAKGDKVLGRISKALNETFITPFDREDINDLAEAMDDAIDSINHSAQKVLLFSPETLPKSTVKLTGIIRKATEFVQAATNELPKLKHNDQQVRRCCKEIKKLEETADNLYEYGIMTLFKEEKNIVELIKLKEITIELETAVNKINHIGKLLKTVIVKYA
jgi:predicted phosphate transport protein (TIGR00153 family)